MVGKGLKRLQDHRGGSFYRSLVPRGHIESGPIGWLAVGQIDQWR